MPRVSRITAPGYPHHVTQRGNYLQPVFETDHDFRQYLSWLKEYREKYQLDIWAYCLMENHVHFICVPQDRDSLARTFNTLHMRYAQYLHKKKNLRGHLWQGRFYSCILDETHLYAAVRYVENNPVRAGIVNNPEEYTWSSARGHINKGSDPLLSEDFYLGEEIKDWKDYLREKDKKAHIENIVKSMQSGRPCGDKDFMEKVEQTIGKSLKVLPKGRPRKRP
jgi:putative transposase